ncbi:DUF2147 domain-containing protein, partial [bacterium]|nr:DUF2147 domain-containing protein [bacterium]
MGIVCAELAPVPRPESVRVEHVAASSSPTRPAAPPVPDEPAPLGDPAPKEAVPVTPPVPSEPPPVKA